MKSYHLSCMSTLPIVPVPDLADRVRSAPATGQAASSVGDLRDEDLHPLLVAFYAAAADDELLAPYFATLDMSAHLPRIVDFWSTMLFHTGRYMGNAFRPHLEMPGLTSEHFSHWLATLSATLDASYAGPAVEQMKMLAKRIAYSMQLRLGIEPANTYTPDL
jgi:hemoglobin